jgi:hypothetical protein
MSHTSRFILIFSVALGLGLGIYIGWIASPVQYTDTSPASLDELYKDDYILMVATIYSEDEDLPAARARLSALGFDDPAQAVAATTHRLIAAQQPEADLRRGARLASALGVITSEMQPYLP